MVADSDPVHALFVTLVLTRISSWLLRTTPLSNSPYSFLLVLNALAVLKNNGIPAPFAMTSGFGNGVVVSPAAEAADLAHCLKTVQTPHVRSRRKRAHKRQSAE